jgi:hypothetical protein
MHALIIEDDDPIAISPLPNASAAGFRQTLRASEIQAAVRQVMCDQINGLAERFI